MSNLLKKFKEYDADKPKVVKEIAGLLGIPINGNLTVEVANRNGFVYVRLRNNTNELIQAFNEKVSPVYGLPVLVKWQTNRYEVVSRDTNRYSDWGSFSAFLPRHGSQHSLNFEYGQGGDVSFIYSRQFVPAAAIPSGTEGAGTIFVEPYVYRNPSDGSWIYIGDESSPDFLPAKPTGSSARMMLLYWDLVLNDPLIATGTFLSESLTGTSSVISAVPVVTNSQHIPIAGIRLVSGTQSLLWDNIYDLRQFSVTTPPPFNGGMGVWDEGVPLGTGTILNFVGPNVDASISGSVIRVFVTGSVGGGGGGSSIDTLGFAGLDEGVPIGTGTFLNVRGERAVLSRSGSMFALDISPDPQELIGIMGWNQGQPLGTGTVLNINGSRLVGSISGTVLNLSSSPDPQDNIGIFALDDSTIVGTGTTVSFESNISVVRTGTTLFVNAVATAPPAPVQTDGFLAQDEGILLGTGTILNFVGAGVTATISGTVVMVNVPSSGDNNFAIAMAVAL